MEKNWFVRSYPFLLVASHIAVMALFIFIMHLPRIFQIGCLVLTGLDFVWAFRYRDDGEPPCGASVGAEGIERPRPGRT